MLTAGCWSWKLESAEECVTTRRLHGLAPKNGTGGFTSAASTWDVLFDVLSVRLTKNTSLCGAFQTSVATTDMEPVFFW